MGMIRREDQQVGIFDRLSTSTPARDEIMGMIRREDQQVGIFDRLSTSIPAREDIMGMIRRENQQVGVFDRLSTSIPAREDIMGMIRRENQQVGVFDRLSTSTPAREKIMGMIRGEYQQVDLFDWCESCIPRRSAERPSDLMTSTAMSLIPSGECKVEMLERARARGRTQSCPIEIRILVLDWIVHGHSARSAARRFGVSASSAVRWHKTFVKHGIVAALKRGGDRRSGAAEALAGTILGWVDEKPAITIGEIRERLAEEGHVLGHGAAWRLIERKNCTVKRATTHASEQNRDDVKEKRQEWKGFMKGLAGVRLVFLDEFGTNTKMARLVVRSKRGERCRVHVPHGHWNTTTVVAAMSGDGIIAHRIIDGSMTGERFLDFVRELAGRLREGDMVVCDNLSAHKVAGVEKTLREAGALLCFVPPYSPDLNPIEKAISQMKSHLRKIAAREKEDLDDAINETVKVVKPEHAVNFIKKSGYPTDPN